MRMTNAASSSYVQRAIFKKPVIFRLSALSTLLALLAIPSVVTAAPNTKTDKSITSGSGLPLDEIRTFVDVFDRIKKAYVEPVEDKTLLDNAIKGMLSELDPHSAYLEASDFKDLQINTSGEFGGLGIEVSMEEGYIKVVTAIDDTPAQAAGILPGDIIIKLDDEQVKGMALDEAINLMRGKPGSKIALTVVRENASQPLVINVTRAIIQVKSVKGEWLEPGFAYLRISQFQVHTPQDMRKKIEELKKSAKTPMSGLVLDLRNNPGGVLQSAVEISDAFLNKGLVVYTQGRLPNSELSFNAEDGDMLNGLPMVVLINSGSASASEIVAGALQDHHRAVLMGTTSFGKGSVQTVLPLSNDRALKLTTARYYTPSGRSIQAQGIVPDIEVEAAKITKLESAAVEFHESDLKGHLSNGNERKELKMPPVTKNDKLVAEEKNLSEKDYQLFQALSLLKGMNIIGQKN
jgi:carboxyl-terminal processing protease